MAELLLDKEVEAIAQPIAVDLGEADIRSAMEAYLEFIALDEKIKHLVDYPGDGARRNTSAGYNHTSAKDDGTIDTNKDNKHIFHYTPDVLDRARSLPIYRRNHKLDEFLLVAEHVWQEAARKTFQKLVMQPALMGIHFPPDGKTNHHLRFLAYEPGVDGVLARGHYDKSTATIALAESHGGLRLGRGPEDIELYERDPNQPIFFRGLGWIKLHKLLGQDTSEIPAWHDVIDTGERVDSDVMRWALIYFINPAHLDTAPSAIETHIPLDLTRLGESALEDQIKI